MATALKGKYLEQVSVRKKIGDILVEKGHLTAEALHTALKKSEQRRTMLGAILLEDRLVSDVALAECIAEQFGLPYINLEQAKIPDEILQEFPEHLVRRYRIIAISKDPLEGWTIAVEDPRVFDQHLLKASIPGKWNPAVAAKSQIEALLTRYYENEKNRIQDLSHALAKNPNSSGEVSIDSLVDKLLGSAIQHNSSDIHIDPADTFLRIRERIDGILNELYELNPGVHSPLISKLKVLSNLDITEKRKPQDGRFRYTVKKVTVDIRISFLPTIRGERVVIRLLNKSRFHISLEEAGFNESLIKQIHKVMSLPHGIVLVTGPTGSGKTTTVYSMLSLINSVERNIITVEDPVEYQFEVINQVQVNPKAGLQFAEILRNILRQDPDVIMVGEIRDKETADIAIRAALTGHLVISTIHTNDSLSTISRLVDMGIDPFLIASTLSAVLSQRLVRKLCYRCSNAGTPVGCEVCNKTGYSGRTAIAEIMIPDNTIREGITERVSIAKLEQHLRVQGFTSMYEDGMEKVKAKVTTESEIKKIRV